ncbi:MAG: metal-dependent hydrolase [Deltaproteobacteria bacterium]|nr:metal-dependent hydrolase [Deltaproteobacteria bacterium]
MKLTYHGHSCFTIESGGSGVIIDPFLNGNPMADIKPRQVKVNAVLVTHGHADHLGDAVEISKANNAPVIGPFELVNYCTAKGATGHPMHIGGGFDFPFGRVKLTIAHHGSTTDTGAVGNPCGFLVTMGGKTIYHAGDTGLFSDMGLIGETNSIDCALVPIGDNFTMGIDDAARAVGMLKPKMAIPMHYNTFEVIRQDPEEFKKKLAGKAVRVEILKPGESVEV